MSSEQSKSAANAYLYVEAGEAPGRKIAIGDGLIVGRAADCGLTIQDTAASRRHMEIYKVKDKLHFRDMGSTNGTLVNGAPMIDGPLQPGDRIQIGETILRFDLDWGDKLDLEDDTTLFKKSILDAEGRAVPVPAHGRAEDLLQAVYSVMNELATDYDPCNLVDRILNTTKHAVDAQRGVVVFASPGGDQLQPCPICGLVHTITDRGLARVPLEQIRISGTVARHVLLEGESVLFRGGGDGGEPDPSPSMLALELRSIICVPLRGKYGVFGILYMDTNQLDQQYGHEDLLLSTAVGNSAGLALENAQMHQQVLEKERMEQEITHAWAIQEGFLVNEWPDDDERYRVYGGMRPAKIVGGDFYDFVQRDAGRVGVLIGDVSGKGVPAALTMAQILTDFRLRSLEGGSPAQVLGSLNKDFVKRCRYGTFCTMCYVELDLTNGSVVCVNAGHNPPIRLTSAGATTFGKASGVPIGVLPDAAWEDEIITLQPGETILLYTDGVVEARGGATVHEGANQPSEFGMGGLMAFLANYLDAAPKTLVTALDHEIERFCKPAEPHDDNTLIALKYSSESS